MSNKVLWFEVLGTDGNKLKKFYCYLFVWKYKDAKEMNYGMTDPEATGIGGGVGEAPAGPGWSTFYVGVADVDKALAAATALGAKVLMPVTKLPDATIAVFADPEGHPVGLAKHP